MATTSKNKKTTKKKSTPRAAADASGKRLVIVESPAKAKTINKYLGPEYIVKASVGHVRDLPSKNKKGDKSPVPGVDLEHDFEPTYEILPGKNKAVTELKQAAKKASEIWFATDMDREGEAIAWHLAHILGIDPEHAQRVVFNAITKDEIRRAFSNPHTIDINKVDAQQARRILDRIVGYQVSPLLWKKIARGLSAGRVQSVAVRLIVEREREIRAHVPDETWKLTARFALDAASAKKLAAAWPSFMAQRDARNNAPTIKSQNAWMAEHNAVRAELFEVGGVDGKSFDISQAYKPLKLESDGRPKPGAEDNIKVVDLTSKVLDIAELAGMTDIESSATEDPDARGPARSVRTITGVVDPATPYKIVSIETKRTKSRPSAPFITSTLQQAASSRLGFPARRTMRTAQSLYEGVEIKGEGSVGLITYMRTDSTHLSDEAVRTARMYIEDAFGTRYLPEKPNRYSSSNKAAQEAHEAIRPTSLAYPPDKVRSALKPDQYKLYKLIWDRFIACQMVPAEWDATSVIIEGGTDPKTPLRFRTSGRVLAFDGFYRVMGVPTSSDEQTLPSLKEGQNMSPFAMEPEQKFSSPPSRFSEASLIKTLESEGIGRPSTYAQIIATIQDRNYVELNERRFFATDLGEVTTDKLVEAFPEIMELGYTRELESELDKIEEDHLNWRQVLARFYGPFTEKLERAHEELTHAKAETTPAPYNCPECGSPCVYRFGKNGRFLSCSTYPKCNYAAPVDRDGKPREIEGSGVACPNCGTEMLKRDGRFGPFLGCARYGEKENPCATIVKLDKKTGLPVAPAPPPIETDIPCEKCGSPLYLRDGARGPWLSCSAFPKCRGRGKWSALDESKQKELEKALADHLKANPIPIIRDMEGNALTDASGKPIVRESHEADEPDAVYDEVA
ncbi:MAG: type I DNA topoisomerase [Phycisphaerales bacterium]|nr:type I DNA topoisomerase [Phycisphaerales bacterium]